MQTNSHLSRLIHDLAKKYGDREELIYKDFGGTQWKSMSWNQFSGIVKKVSNALLNLGVKVQDHWEMEGLTTHAKRRPLAPHATKLPLEFQDHGNPVRFRNIWIREIPSRYANVTHGGPAADPAAVKELRRKTAAALAAKADWSGATATSVIRALEVVSYSDEPEYRAKANAACAAYRKLVGDAPAARFASDLRRVKATTDAFVRNKVLSADDPFVSWVNAVAPSAK